MALTRRSFLKHSSAGAAALFAPNTARADADPQFAPFDRLMENFLAEHAVPGAAIAVSRKQEIVYSNGFGLADVKAKRRVQADSLFRIASLSKPITAVAVLRLVDAGKVKLDDPVLRYVRLKPHLEAGKTMDPRWHLITVRHCLQHTGGWNRDKSGDPIGITPKIAKALNQELPVSAERLVRYMMGQPLDSDPGVEFAYSNLGYLVLGRIMETVTGRKYEEYVRKEVLAPLGIQRMQLGRALPENRANGEVHYYDSKQATGRCLYPPRLGERVPFPDGAGNLEGYEAHGGWIASAIDLVKFASAFDRTTKCPILSQSAIETMWQRPHGLPGFEKDGKPREVCYGCGWSVRPAGERALNAWHTGLISGSSTLLVRRRDGLNWAVLFNTDRDQKGNVLSGLIDPLIHKAVDEVF